MSGLVRVELEDAYEDLAERAQAREGAVKGEDGQFDPGQTSKAELYEEARRRDIPGRSKMTKDELAEALRARA